MWGAVQPKTARPHLPERSVGYDTGFKAESQYGCWGYLSSMGDLPQLSLIWAKCREARTHAAERSAQGAGGVEDLEAARLGAALT